MNLSWLTYNSSVLTRSSDPLGALPAGGQKHVVCQYLSGSRPMTDGRWDSSTQVDAANNIWDVYCASDDWHAMFTGNNAATLLRIIDADLTGVTDVSGLFSQCSGLYDVQLRNLSSVTDMSMMFNKCASIRDIYMDGVSAVTNTKSMFYQCLRIESVPLFDTSNVTDMSYMFYQCEKLKSVPMFDMSSNTTMEWMFYDCYDLTSVPLFDTSSVTSMRRAFQSCRSLKEVPLLDTSSVTNMAETFYDCVQVESGAPALYTQASTQATPPSSHNNCFAYCGYDTVSGSADLFLIPRSWGGYAA